MGKPTKDQLEDALATAKRMREAGDDPHYLAKSLLNLNYRMDYMAKVFEAAEYYLRGEDAHARVRLEQAIEKARAEERRTAGSDDETLGL